MKHLFAIKFLGISAVFILLLVCAGPALAGISTDVVLNKSVLLNLKSPAGRISVAKPELADVILISPMQLQIRGIALGDTSLIVWERGSGKATFFDIHVIGDTMFIEDQIRQIALPNDDIKVKFVNEHIELYGHAHNQQTVDKAVEIAAAYAAKDVVRKETRPDGTVTEVTAREFINHIVIDNPQEVLLQVKVAQVDKTAMKKLGVSGMVKNKNAEGFYNLIGPPSGGATTSTQINGAGGSTSSQVGSGTGISANVPGLGSFNPLDAFTMGISYFPSGIGAVLQALANKDLAKILAEPNLVVKSGSKGEFNAGSKIPYQVLVSSGGNSTTSITWEDVGIKLIFAPEVLDNGLIRLTIDPAEVSSLGSTLQANGYPIINTRNVRTRIDMRDGESLVLAGLYQESEIRDMSKIPILGDIPILGALFRATDKELEETELVFFITPKLVTAMAPGSKAELPTDQRLTPQEEKEYKWIPMGK
ncbi:MAG TPA: pilus assembly protein N-terminal domain-containing protein [Geobacteraceae bacterium]|nr:pilus assembly protein N-terminal domain-containing protein [Geobacteraceae bacterium]